MLRNIISVDPDQENHGEEEEEEVVFTTNVIKIPNQLEENDDDVPNKVIIEATETVSTKQTKFSETSIFGTIKEENSLQFVISVDGSNHSSLAFELVTLEFLKPDYKLTVMHVYNTALDDCYNYVNKRDTVLWDYSVRLIKYGAQSNFVAEDRTSKLHALEQVNRMATARDADFLVVGYYGIKGARGSNVELSKGIDYLLGNSRSPTILVKEKSSRKDKPGEGFKWLFVMDKQYSNCVQCFRTFSHLIDPVKDHVYGFSLLPSYINYDINKNEFMDEINKKGIENYEYSSEPYVKDPHTMVIEKVNFETTGYDFLVFYNNPRKHKQDPENSHNVSIIKSCMANICFINGEFGK